MFGQEAIDENQGDAMKVNLLCIAGVSPAVITETVWGLVVGDEERSVEIERIVVVTTVEGRKRASDLLVRLSELVDTWPAAKGRVPLTEERVEIQVPCDSQGRELLDVRTVEENVLIGDWLTRVVKELTADGEPALHASLAGGRKTMSYFLGAVMSFFGRVEDRLSHVLTSDRVTQCKEFYYPTTTSRIMTTYAGEEFDASQEVIELNEIPFLRLRQQVSGIHQWPDSFMETVEAGQVSLSGEQKLELDFFDGTVFFGDMAFRFSLTERMLFLTIVAEWSAGRIVTGSSLWEDTGHLRKVVAQLLSEHGEEDASDSIYYGDDDIRGAVRSSITKLNKTIQSTTTEIVANRLKITNVGQRGEPQYVIGLDPTKVILKNSDQYPGEHLD